jgi:hypothetical protein
MLTQVFEMTDNDFLQWIYNRMVEVHNENELYDYMHKFKGIIEKNKMIEKNKNQNEEPEMKVYDYRIVEKLNLGTMKPYFIIQKYNLLTQEYNLHSNVVIQTLEEAQEAIRLIRKYKEPMYHYVE